MENVFAAKTQLTTTTEKLAEVKAQISNSKVYIKSQNFLYLANFVYLADK